MDGVEGRETDYFRSWSLLLPNVPRIFLRSQAAPPSGSLGLQKHLALGGSEQPLSQRLSL